MRRVDKELIKKHTVKAYAFSVPYLRPIHSIDHFPNEFRVFEASNFYYRKYNLLSFIFRVYSRFTQANIKLYFMPNAPILNTSVEKNLPPAFINEKILLQMLRRI